MKERLLTIFSLMICGIFAGIISSEIAMRLRLYSLIDNKGKAELTIKLTGHLINFNDHHDDNLEITLPSGTITLKKWSTKTPAKYSIMVKSSLLSAQSGYLQSLLSKSFLNTPVIKSTQE